jgi:hypothetical protein
MAAALWDLCALLALSILGLDVPRRTPKGVGKGLGESSGSGDANRRSSRSRYRCFGAHLFI